LARFAPFVMLKTGASLKKFGPQAVNVQEE
jgi:hypothetical protein